MNTLSQPSIRIVGWMLALAMMFAAWSLWSQEVQAQGGAAAQPAAAADAGAAAEPATDDASAEEADRSLGGLILSGGSFGVVFYIILGIFSVAAMSVALERAVNLRRQKVIPTDFVDRLRNMIARNDDDLEGYQRICEGAPSPILNILKAGVFRTGRPLPEVEKAMEDAAAREMAEMRSRNRPLSVVGSVAPLVGLLGTVVGMIFAFRVSSQAGLGKAELLAEGIYLALMTTAAGLTIAIPCLLLVAWFNGRVERYMREIDECLLETMPSFTRMEQTTVVERKPANQPELAEAAS